MILLGIFFIPLLICLVCILVGLYRHHSAKHSTGYFSDGLIASFVVGAICAVILTVLVFSTSANGRSKVNSIKSINQKLLVVEQQKRGEIAYLNEALGPDEVELIADAITVDDSGAKIFFSNNSAVSALVISKAEKVIAANGVIFELQNKIRDTQSAICSNENNPFIPVFDPFYPDCDLNWDAPVGLDPSFYDGDDD